MTWHNDFTKNILRFNTLSRNETTECVVYGGDIQSQTKDFVLVTGFEKFSTLFKGFGVH